MNDGGELRNLQLLQEAFDAFAKLQWDASIELPLCSYALKHRVKRHMPFRYCSTEQAVVASLLYGCWVDFGPKTLRKRFLPEVFGP